jgi:hypothetical protein
MAVSESLRPQSGTTQRAWAAKAWTWGAQMLASHIRPGNKSRVDILKILKKIGKSVT